MSPLLLKRTPSSTGQSSAQHDLFAEQQLESLLPRRLHPKRRLGYRNGYEPFPCEQVRFARKSDNRLQQDIWIQKFRNEQNYDGSAVWPCSQAVSVNVRERRVRQRSQLLRWTAHHLVWNGSRVCATGVANDLLSIVVLHRNSVMMMP
jgi:hypothetical protein